MLLGYIRVSTIEQAASDRTSLAEQENRVKGCALMRGAASDLVIYRDPGISGSIPLNERPAGAQMLKDAQPGDIVIASKLDRVFRSSEDALRTTRELHEHGIGVILCDISPDPIAENGVGKLFFSVLAATAEFERWRISERMQDGRRGKRAAGGHQGGDAPFGFKVVGKGRAAKLVPNEHEQAIVRLMCELRQAGRSYRRITPELTRRGLLSRSGTPFGSAQIRRIINRVPQQQAAE
jgi:putative DNA-invertase from lambdoid prophage Rac